MSMIDRHLAWYAADADGELAVFWNAGTAPVPRCVLRSAAAHDAVHEGFDMSQWGALTPWAEYARAGLFVFHWDRSAGHHGPYRRLRAPAGAVSGELRQILETVPGLPRYDGRFAQVESLADAHVVQLEPAHLPCAPES